MMLKFGGLLECAEKATIVAEMGKLIVEVLAFLLIIASSEASFMLTQFAGNISRDNSAWSKPEILYWLREDREDTYRGSAMHF